MRRIAFVAAVVLGMALAAGSAAASSPRTARAEVTFNCRIGHGSDTSRDAAPTAYLASFVQASRTSMSASDLRLALGRLLGEHAYLTMEAMRAAAANRPDANALIGALGQNTADLTDAVSGVYGSAAGDRFRELWQQHIDALISWARAHATGDSAAVQAAVASMASFRTTFSAFLGKANPHLSGDAEAHALQMHLDQLTAFVDMDYAQVFATERAAYAHMFEFGDGLASAIAAQFPKRYVGINVAFSPRTALRLDLGRLLGEHLILAAEALRSGLDAQPDAGAARDALAANTADIALLVGRIYGADAQAAFNQLWARHIATYLRYVDAVRSGNTTDRAAALAELRSYPLTLAQFLHGAIPALRVTDVETLLSHHVSALISQVDATAAGDSVRSVAVTREAYAHMFLVGDVLGTAIANQFPERFRDMKELPGTSTAPGESDSTGNQRLFVALAGAIAFVLGAALPRRRFTRAVRVHR